MALLFGRRLGRLAGPISSRLAEAQLTAASQEEPSTTTSLPAGHKNSDLREVMCNIRLSRMRDITLRQDVNLYQGDKPIKLKDVFRVKTH